ncbi:MAG: J domain-containing protein [Acidobacteriota bacterium]|nr:J domain-containing protein [Acidobacteriota bacterium]
MKNHYELLEIDPGAPVEAIKHAFRQQIARYHPDKVQHLGRELQELAATRTAELTEAYRILSDPDKRRQYDQLLDLSRTSTAAAPAPPAGTATPPAPAATPAPAPGAARERGARFSHERTRRDEFVRRAVVERFKQAVIAELGQADLPVVRGFDLAFVPRAKLFSRQRPPRVLGRFVGRVDGSSLEEAWGLAAAWTKDEVCVFLMGPELATARELAEATASQRDRVRNRQITVVPVDARDWQALVPNTAPPLVHAVLTRLRSMRS